MTYLLLAIVIIMWSTVGILVKIAGTMVDSNMITFCRFFFGILFLGILLLIKDGKIRVIWRSQWIWFAVIGKTTNYVFENLALSMGSAYTNIVVMPIQAIFLASVATFFLKEKMNFKKGLALVLCIVGVTLVGGKGASLEAFLSDGILPLILFTLSAIGAGLFVLGQKVLADKMDAANMNFSVFLISSLFTALPLPFTKNMIGSWSMGAMLALIALGLITGISFYINSIILQRLPLLVAGIFGNTSVLFTLVWVKLFFNETINSYVIIGAIVFVTGIIILNLPNPKKIENTIEII